MSELDDVAKSVEKEIDDFLGRQFGSRNYIEVAFAADKSVGDYPQAMLDDSRPYLEDDGDLYLDRFPKSLREPILLDFSPKAKWTDVLSSDLWPQGYLLNRKAKSIFDNFGLGNVNVYKAEVRDGAGATQEFEYLFAANQVSLEDLDFSQCEFYLADRLGRPLHPVEVTSAEDFERKRVQAVNGKLEGSRRLYSINFKKLTFRSGHTPESAIFGVGRLDSTAYFSWELYFELDQARVTGLEFKRNRRLFD